MPSTSFILFSSKPTCLQVITGSVTASTDSNSPRLPAPLTPWSVKCQCLVRLPLRYLSQAPTPASQTVIVSHLHISQRSYDPSPHRSISSLYLFLSLYIFQKYNFEDVSPCLNTQLASHARRKKSKLPLGKYTGLAVGFL